MPQGCREKTDGFRQDQPNWVAFTNNGYSYTRMTLHNSTHVTLQQVGVDQVLHQFILYNFYYAADSTTLWGGGAPWDLHPSKNSLATSTLIPIVTVVLCNILVFSLGVWDHAPDPHHDSLIMNSSAWLLQGCLYLLIEWECACSSNSEIILFFVFLFSIGWWYYWPNHCCPAQAWTIPLKH